MKVAGSMFSLTIIKVCKVNVKIQLVTPSKSPPAGETFKALPTGEGLGGAYDRKGNVACHTFSRLTFEIHGNGSWLSVL